MDNMCKRHLALARKDTATCSGIRQDEHLLNIIRRRTGAHEFGKWLRVPLYNAARDGCASVVKELLATGAFDTDSSITFADGQTLMHAAVCGGSTEVVEALIDSGARCDIETREEVDSRTPLHLAAVKGDVAVARALIIAGADVDARDKYSNTPLHLAIEHGGCYGMIVDLLANGANVECWNNEGDMPLHTATRSGHLPTVQALLAGLAPPDTRSKNFVHDFSALEIAAAKGDADVMAALLAHGADPNSTSTSCVPTLHSVSALHCALEKKQVAAMTLLIEHGAVADGASLDDAVKFDNYEAIEALVRAGADINWKPSPARPFDGTALHRAVCSLNMTVTRQLLRLGADETIPDNQGRTPLQLLDFLQHGGRDNSRQQRSLLRSLLVNAPANRAWQRRGWIIMLRAGCPFAATAEARRRGTTKRVGPACQQARRSVTRAAGSDAVHYTELARSFDKAVLRMLELPEDGIVMNICMFL